MSSRCKLHVLACFFVLSILTLSGYAAAADSGDRYVVRLPLKGPSVYKSLVEINIEVLALNKGGLIDVVADSKQLDYLQTLGVPISIMRTPDMQGAAAVLDENLGMYHTYAEMETVLTDLETTYPTLAELDVMGTSVEGRNIYVLKISDNVTLSEGEPEVLFMGNHHAREIMTVDITLRFAVYLLENYGIDPTVTAMVDNREIYIAPMINPDGHFYVQQNHSGGSGDWWRKNRRDNGDGSHGVDLNRNYGYTWGFDDIGSSPNPWDITYRGTAEFSEPETQAVRDFCNSHRFTMWLSYHSYGELLLFPWGFEATYTDDHDVFLALADTLTSSNGYEGANFAMGSLGYAVNGDTDDWGYGDTSERDPIFAFTPEVNSGAQGGFGPDDSWIQPTFDLLLPMNMLTLQFADNPYRAVGPWRPTQHPIDESSPPQYVVNWSPNDPEDPNPIIGYDVIEYKNLGSVAQDPANDLSTLWIYDGFVLSGARAFEGSGSYFSGAEESNTSHTMRTATPYMVTAETDTFTSQVWYDIETNWDYAYLEISADGGITWETVPGNLTTDYDPYGNNHGNGITGSSNGWVEAVFSLTQYLGMDLELRYSYVMDALEYGEGIYIDLPGPVPTYESVSPVATGTTDTTLTIIPDETGSFTYRIRGRDSENQLSPWSNSQTITIDDITAVGDIPRLASRLGPNYPNPFNPTTRIPYTVGSLDGGDRAVRVHLGIFNIAGQRIAQLVDRELAPGVYEAVWNGKTDLGRLAPSGVYFARLSVAGEQFLTRKLVLLK